MKRFASLFLVAAMLCTLLTVLAVPASAENEPKEITVDQTKTFALGDCVISKPGEYETQILKVASGSKLTIAQGVTIKVTLVLDNQGEIELLGTLDLSQCSRGINYNTSLHIGDTGEFIYTPDPNEAEAISGGGYSRDVIFRNGSILSEGNLTIIVGVAAAVVFGIGGFFIGKAVEKKKKTALADVTDNKDE